ncbi:hypothetical protein GGR57DRAFT_288733 [Xylariaceae sp. FL1272]|nr:hypothetical protein GGR57DRAFT_288733 [Xylariaceae sp. FL1272]
MPFLYYAVRKGRVPGVYSDWESCKAQTNGCPNQYKGFDSYAEAVAWFQHGNQQATIGRNDQKQSERLQQLNPSNLYGTRPKRQPWDTRVADAAKVKVEAPDASQSFFTQVPKFEADPQLSFDDEFHRFASSQNLKLGSKEWREQRTGAISHELKYHYSHCQNTDDEGKDVNEQQSPEQERLVIYQNMCLEAGLIPLGSIEACVTKLKGILVNIVDYIDYKRGLKPIKIWAPKDFYAFRAYSLDPRHRIDLETAKSDEFLAALLQRLRGPGCEETFISRRAAARNASKTSVLATASSTATDMKNLAKEKSNFGGESGQTEIIIIPDSDSECSSPTSTVEEDTSTLPSSPDSSVILQDKESPCSSQKRMKRSLSEALEDEEKLSHRQSDIRELTHKRRRAGYA